MATDAGFVAFVAEQAGLGPRLTSKKMFGEYGIYVDGKMVALACDDQLFIKPLPSTAALYEGLPLEQPYPQAKPHPVIDALLDEPDRLRALLLATAAAVPEPKPKAKDYPKKAAVKKTAKKKPA